MMSGFRHGGGYENEPAATSSSGWRHGGYEEPQAQQPDVLRESEAFESWPSYLGRNAAKVPGLAYATVSSGAGIGDVMREIQENVLGVPKGTNPYYEMPTFGEALEQYGRGVSKVAGPEWAKTLTESRPEDYWPEFAAQTILPAALTGGLSSGPAILRTLGMLGGGELAGTLGESALEQIGLPKTGRALGTLWGGHYGEKGAQAAMSMSTGSLAPRVEEHEAQLLKGMQEDARKQYQEQKAAFEASEEQRVNQERNLLVQLYGPGVENAFLEENNTAQQLAKEQEAFRLDKRQRIEKARQEIGQYDEYVGSLIPAQKEAYDTAKKLRTGNEIGDPSAIMDAGNHAVTIGGLDAADEAAIRKAATDISAGIIDDTMTLDKAIELQKNFNGQWKYGKSNFRRAIKPMIDQLNNFIKEVGGEEHYGHWSKAEELTSQIKDLEKNRAAFVKKQETSMSDINKEKFSETRQNFLETQAAEAKRNRINKQTESNAARNAIGARTWDDWIRDEHRQHLLEKRFIDAATEGFEKTEIPKGTVDIAIKTGLGALGAALGYLGLGGVGLPFGALGGYLGKKVYNEIAFAKKVFKKYPALKTETYKLIGDATKLNPKNIAFRLSILGRKMDQMGRRMET